MVREDIVEIGRVPRPAVWLRHRVLALSRHWLAWANLFLGALVGVPWLAPILMKVGAVGPARLIYLAYGFLCHQLADRSFFLFGPKWMYSATELLRYAPGADTWPGLRAFVGTPELGYKVAWSDRMMALYGGLFLGGLLFALVRRRTPALNWRTLGLLTLPMVVDGATHWVSDLAGLGQGFRYTNAWLARLAGHLMPQGFYVGNALGSFNSWMRLGTGLLFGLAVAWVAYPALEAIFKEQGKWQGRTVAPERWA